MTIHDKTKWISIDTETTGLNPWKGDRVFAISICTEEGETSYIEFPVNPATRQPDYSSAESQQKIQAFLSIWTSPVTGKVFHNATFDRHMIVQSFGVEMQGDWIDTMILAHLWNNLEPDYTLKRLAFHYLQYPTTDEIELKTIVRKARVVGKQVAKIADDLEADYWLPAALGMGNDYVKRYCISDAERTMLLFLFYRDALSEQGRNSEIVEEHRLLDITYLMEKRGMMIHLPTLHEELKRCNCIIERETQFLQSVAPSVKNWNSHKQVGQLLFGERGLTPISYTGIGTPQVNMQFLLHHYDDPICASLIRLRRAEKARDAFFVPYVELAEPTQSDYAIIHARFNQAGPATGRYSCRQPNLQQVANPETDTVANVDHIRIRAPFCPRPGYVWICADYSQLEVRIFASVSQEKNLCNAIAAGRDIHAETANRVFGGQDNPAAIRMAVRALELESPEVSSELVKQARNQLSGQGIDAVIQWLEKFDWDICAAERSVGKETSRHIAKQLTFGKLYGGGITAIKRVLNCSTEEARTLLYEYDRAFPGIREYSERLQQETLERGYIVNPFGRRLYVPPDRLYACVNYMVQGSAASLLKTMMRKLNTAFRQYKLDAWIILNLHDEIVIEINKNQYNTDICKTIKQIMESTDKWFNVPMEVKLSLVSTNWSIKEDIQ